MRRARHGRRDEEILPRVRRTAAKLLQRPGPRLSGDRAKLGPYVVAGLDISDSSVRLAADNAKKAQVDVDFHRAAPR
jgi:hypothetical protein